MHILEFIVQIIVFAVIAQQIEIAIASRDKSRNDSQQ